jgi:enoyl-CoA hydratase
MIVPEAVSASRLSFRSRRPKENKVPKVIYAKDGRIGRVTLNRPEVMNAIDDDVPLELAECVAKANADPGVHVIVLSGAGEAFCAGYDLTYYAQGTGGTGVTQEMPWDPMKDYAFMMRNTAELFMSLWRSYRPVICKVHGYAVAGGSDIALCADMIVMSTDARIGYMPTRVWGCPTTAMWVYRLGPERAKRMLFTGDKITGKSRCRGRGVGGADGDRAGQSAHDAEARRQSGHRGHGAEEYPTPCHNL